MKSKPSKPKAGKSEFDDYLTSSLEGDPELKTYFWEEVAELPLASQIRLLRRFRRQTQLALAKRTRFAQPVIARLEKGEVDPRSSTIERLDKALGLRHVPVPVELLGYWNGAMLRRYGNNFFYKAAGE